MWDALFLVVAMLHPPARTFIKPKGFHVAFTENPSELSVSWLTYVPQWGATLSLRTDTCGYRGNSWRHFTPKQTATIESFAYDVHILNHVRISGLSSRCAYRYKAGFGVQWSQELALQGWTAFDISNASESDLRLSASVIVFGDMGSARSSATTRSHIHDFLEFTPVHAVLHSGDIAYNLRNPLPSFIRRYFVEVEDFAGHIPYMVAAGNHEKFRNFTRYRELLRMPKDERNETSIFYSFNLGRAHFVVYCAEFLFLDMQESEQTHLNWLRADLAEANRHRNTTPWIVAVGHRPLYCGINWLKPLSERYGFQSNFDCSFRAEIVRSHLEEVFNAAGVDLVISSHVHNYERFAAVYHNSSALPRDPHFIVDPTAPLYVVSGAAGNVEQNDPVTPTPDPWQMSATAELGFGRLLVANATDLYWEQWNSRTRERHDFVWVQKTRLRYGI